MFPANSMGFYDVYGNVWEWVEDQYNGLPGFKTHYLYEDYSATYCDKKHNLILVYTHMGKNLRGAKHVLVSHLAV